MLLENRDRAKRAKPDHQRAADYPIFPKYIPNGAVIPPPVDRLLCIR
jgi:hypothetical protein